ncbi:MAG: membrane protein insertion efficiency factor YidD [Puniceicoccales bacterium]|nr:membrane protein insertion efficiency factor YidD [Puniceicoccales bacterium]
MTSIFLKPFNKICKFFAILLIKSYRKILSPLKVALLGPSARCRFYPTCSSFAQSMFRRYTFRKAFYFSMRRILRCNPFWKHRQKPNKSSLLMDRMGQP